MVNKDIEIHYFTYTQKNGFPIAAFADFTQALQSCSRLKYLRATDAI